VNAYRYYSLEPIRIRGPTCSPIFVTRLRATSRAAYRAHVPSFSAHNGSALHTRKEATRTYYIQIHSHWANQHLLSTVDSKNPHNSRHRYAADNSRELRVSYQRLSCHYGNSYSRGLPLIHEFEFGHWLKSKW